MALVGRFDAQHALIVSAILAHLDFLDEQIDLLSDAIAEQLAPFAAAVELLCTIPGVQRRTAEVIIAEIGADMSRFPSARHLASWAGQCPGNDRSAGKRRSGKTRHGSKWLDTALTEAAMAATRSKDVYLAAQYQRLRPRRGHGRPGGRRCLTPPVFPIRCRPSPARREAAARLLEATDLMATECFCFADLLGGAAKRPQPAFGR